MQTLDVSLGNAVLDQNSMPLNRNESGEYSFVHKDNEQSRITDIDGIASSKGYKSVRLAGGNSVNNSPSPSRDKFRYNILYNKIK